MEALDDKMLPSKNREQWNICLGYCREKDYTLVNPHLVISTISKPQWLLVQYNHALIQFMPHDLHMSNAKAHSQI